MCLLLPISENKLGQYLAKKDSKVVNYLIIGLLFVWNIGHI